MTEVNDLQKLSDTRWRWKRGTRVYYVTQVLPGRYRFDDGKTEPTHVDAWSIEQAIGLFETVTPVGPIGYALPGKTNTYIPAPPTLTSIFPNRRWRWTGENNRTIGIAMEDTKREQSGPSADHFG
jgi:hypothetical protein